MGDKELAPSTECAECVQAEMEHLYDHHTQFRHTRWYTPKHWICPLVVSHTRLLLTHDTHTKNAHRYTTQSVYPLKLCVCPVPICVSFKVMCVSCPNLPALSRDRSRHESSHTRHSSTCGRMFGSQCMSTNPVGQTEGQRKAFRTCWQILHEKMWTSVVQYTANAIN